MVSTKLVPTMPTNHNNKKLPTFCRFSHTKNLCFRRKRIQEIERFDFGFVDKLHFYVEQEKRIFSNNVEMNTFQDYMDIEAI